MNIDAQPLPLPLVAVLRAAMEGLDDQALRELAAAHPELARGFRLGKASPAVLRTRALAAFDRMQELPDAYRAALRQATLTTSLTGVLSEAALGAVFAPLAAMHGASLVCASLLLDERETVRRIGFDRIAACGDGEPGDGASDDAARRVASRGAAPSVPSNGATAAEEGSRRARGAAEFTNTLAPFLEHLASILTANDTPAGGAPEARPANPAPPRPDLERQLADEARERRFEANRLKRELDKAVEARVRLDSQVGALARSLEAEQRAGRALAGERDALATELAALRDGIRREVDAELVRRLDARVAPWLARAESLLEARDQGSRTGPHAKTVSGEPHERAAAAGLHAEAGTVAGRRTGREAIAGRPRDRAGPVDLVAEAETLLRRQAEVDLQFGLRSALESELACVEALHARLLAARADALKPLPEIGLTARRLDERIVALRALLGRPAPPDAGGVLARLEGVLASAGSLEELSARRQALQAAESLELLTEPALERAFERVRETASRLYAARSMERGWKDDPSALSAFPVHALQSAIARGSECVLVVDGHNLLFRLPALFRAHYERGLPGARARDALERMLVGLAERNPGLAVHLWFDSETLADRSASPSVRVHFSGGDGTDRADRRIDAYLAHLNQASPDTPRAVVSADRAVADGARAAGAMVMTPGELAGWLHA